MTNHNNLRDEMSFEKQQISELSFAEKMEFYWQKYKVHIIVTVLLACLFGSILHPVIHQKETVLSIAYINAFPNVEDQVIIDELEKYKENENLVIGRVSLRKDQEESGYKPYTCDSAHISDRRTEPAEVH